MNTMNRLYRTGVGWLMATLGLLIPSSAAPAIIKFSCHPFVKRGHAKVLAGGNLQDSGRALVAALGRLMRPVAALACVALVAFALTHLGELGHHFGAGGVFSLAVTVAAKPANIRQMEADFRALAKELEIGQSEMALGPITQARGEELTRKAKEMEELQKHLDQYNTIAGITRKAREVESPTLPSDEKGRRPKQIKTTPGHLFVMSDAYSRYKAEGKQGWSAKVDIGNLRGGLVKLSGEEATAFEVKAYDGALSELGENAIIEMDRDRDIVRFEEPEMLTIRDVLNVVPTTSDAIRYVKHVATDRGAAGVPKAEPKPWLKVTFEATDVSVQTIAVLSKVTEQDIEDAPRLVGYINNEMELDVRVEEERQLLNGSGYNGEILGLYAQGVEEFEDAEYGDTLIDTIRRMRAALRKRRVVPNFVTVDPLDWADIELQKGTDDRYIWGMITDLRGPRIWSLNVVESDAMTNELTGERRLLMGDGRRGATIYDRHDVRLAVGYVDDDFARNLRTLRAEERLALAVKRAWAFSYVVTKVAS